jgi:hypothetical protein
MSRVNDAEEQARPKGGIQGLLEILKSRRRVAEGGFIVEVRSRRGEYFSHHPSAIAVFPASPV